MMTLIHKLFNLILKTGIVSNTLFAVNDSQ